MFEHYINSYEKLMEVTKLHGFPKVKDWNFYATANNYLSNKSLEYISKMNWKKLKIRVQNEVKMDFIKKFFA